MNTASINLTRILYCLKQLRFGWFPCCVGWILFLASLFLPAFWSFGSWVYGWDFAWTVLLDLPHSLKYGVGSALFVLANSAILASPPLMHKTCRSVWGGRVVQGMLLAATLWISWLLTLPHDMDYTSYDDFLVGIGSYVWVVALWLLFVGSWCLSSRTGAKPSHIATAHPAPSAIMETPETLAARRELNDFLQIPHEDGAFGSRTPQ